VRQFTHHHIGQIGEKAAAEFYMRDGFSLVATNYRKLFGEIDLVVEKNKLLVFVEVKSVSCETFSAIDELHRNPVENIHNRKRLRLRKTVLAFLEEYPIQNREWQFDVAIVQVNTVLSTARVDLIQDIIL
jgi:putative endonuclease